MQTPFITNAHAQEKNIKVTQNEETINIQENDSKYTIKREYKPGKVISSMVDENNNVTCYFINDYENKTLYSSITNKFISLDDDFYDTDETFDISNSNVRAYGKVGSKENPSRYCTPGSRRKTSSKLSYAQIMQMVGAGASTATITTALLSKYVLGIAVNTQVITNTKVIAAEIANNIASAGNHTWVGKHGILINLTYACSLQHYVDNAWGDDEWFYGEQTATVSYSMY